MQSDASPVLLLPTRVDFSNLVGPNTYVVTGEFAPVQYGDVPDLHALTCNARGAVECTANPACALDASNLCQPRARLTNDEALSNVFRRSSMHRSDLNPHRNTNRYLKMLRGLIDQTPAGTTLTGAVFGSLATTLEDMPSIHEMKCGLITTHRECLALGCKYDAATRQCATVPGGRLSNYDVVRLSQMSVDDRSREDADLDQALDVFIDAVGPVPVGPGLRAAGAGMDLALAAAEFDHAIDAEIDDYSLLTGIELHDSLDATSGGW